MSTIELSKQYLERILNLLGVDGQVEVEELGGEDSLQVNTKDQALLIGRRGDNLKSLQYLIYQMVRKTKPDAPIVTIDVAGYRKDRLKRLDIMVGLAKTQIFASHEPVELAPMNAYERRYVHNLISEDPELISQSSGQEPSRRIVISKSQ